MAVLPPTDEVHLGEQGGGDLHEVGAALVDGGGEACEVADHAAAEGHDKVAPVQLQGEEFVAQGLQAGEALGLLAGRQDDGVDGQASPLEGGGQSVAMQAPDGAVRDHGDAVPADEAAQPLTGGLKKAGANEDLVGAFAQVDGDGSGHEGVRDCELVRARITWSTVTWWGELPVSTVMSASA